MSEPAHQFDVHPDQIKQWKDHMLARAGDVFDDAMKDDAMKDDAMKKEKAPEIDVTMLHAKIGQFSLENDFLSGALDKAGLLPGARK